MFRLMLDRDFGERAHGASRCEGGRPVAWRHERTGDSTGPPRGAGADLATRTHCRNTGPEHRRSNGRFAEPGFPPVRWDRLSALVGEERTALRPAGVDRTG